ncbi:caspase-3-like [Megalops cyprinoides]|uniref:caspase-3-like n=1 Tax=Megalops cyprinoides TaxID=118141 RepID=UPI0018647A9A|nr:caspase-3-like [Megalops cyprinoides]
MNASVISGTRRSDRTMDFTAQHTEKKSIEENPYQFWYSRDYKHIGKCLIINNENFFVMNPRIGTKEDERLLRHSFASLGFTLQVERDLSADSMLQVLQAVSAEDHGERACFVCVLLSHGQKGTIFGTDREIPLRRLTSLFTATRCPSLEGKPKLFFIQACRGHEYDSGIETDSKEEEEDEKSIEMSEIPERDFLCGHSTTSGYYSWRNPSRGSIYIRTLCEMLTQHRSLEITKILTRVNHKVALEFESGTFEWRTDRKKQMPCIISMLTKELFFTP